MARAVDKLILNSELAAGALQDNDFSNVIFSFAQTASGSWSVLSKFSDDIWNIPDSYFTTNTAGSFKKLDFRRIPESFRHLMKVCILKYYLFGVFNQGAPRGATIVNFFVGALSFLNYVAKHTVNLKDISPVLFSNYVLDAKSLKGRNSETLSVDSRRLRFTAIETLHHLSQDTTDPMPHPWPDSSASTLSGKNGTAWYLKGKTPVIPDSVLSLLFQKSVEDIENIDWLLDLKDECRAIKSRIPGPGYSTLHTMPYLKSMGYSGGERELNKAIRNAYIASAVIILTTSGVRNHELLSLKTDCYFSTLDDDGGLIHWLRGRSEKTYEGDAEWIVTDITKKATAAASRITMHLRCELERNIKDRLMSDPDCLQTAALEVHQDAIFIGKDPSTGEIRTITGGWLGSLIRQYCEKIGITWDIAPHQFRRTFAVYVVRSAMGDIRYLKTHFKHWTLDMTALYASHEQRDSELLDEVMAAFYEAKNDIFDHALNESTPLSGGLAETVRNYRAAKVQTYSTHSEMVKTVSDTVFIRSTAVAWCTHDLVGCVGGVGVEATRCADCSHSLIDDTKIPIWKGIYSQQQELIHLTDIGASGIERVKRDLDRCVKVLSDLGVTVEGSV
ncbi:hypothetical protein [Pseudomonas veronii]